MVTHTPPSAYAAAQDALIGARLPYWLRSASVEQLAPLQDAMGLSLYFRQRVRQLLAGLQGIDRFAEPLLVQALRARFGAALDIHRLRFRLGHREPVITSQPIGYPVTVPVYAEIGLFEAALRNFTAAEAEAGGQLPGNGLVDPLDAQAKLPCAQQFASLCRELDLGGRYQRHLQGILEPADGEARRQVLSLLARARRYGMLADAHVARIKGALNEAELQLLVRLCGLHRAPTLEGSPVIAKRLSLLGCTLEQIVVLDVRDESLSPLYSTSRRVLVHIPDDPQAPWQAFPDLRHFANALGKRLRTPQYQRFFSRFVRRRDSQRFFASVVQGYQGVSELANIDLEARMHAYPEPLFDSLARARIGQIKDDAAMIAVPKAEVDRQVQREHAQRLAAEGWTLLNLAGLFVPVIGAALLAVSAWELLGEVYHGIEAWHEGETTEALEHLFNVAIDVAVVAATAAGITLVRNAWSRSSLVDSLLPAQLEDGSTRLYKLDLAAFRSEAPPPQAVPDAQGIHRLGAQAWIEMDGHHYPIVQRAGDGRWQLRPQGGHGPLLCHNGAGAWRLWSEQPARWDDPHRLFRRLGGPFARLDDEQIDQLMTAHGLEASHLRALHVQGQAPEAQLVDSVERVLLEQRIRELVGRLRGGEPVSDRFVLQHAQALPGAAGLPDQGLAELAWNLRRPLFQRLYESAQGRDKPGVATLRRAFPGLHGRAAEALLEAARVADRRRLLDTGRVALRLAESARTSVGQIRVARVFEALYLDTLQTGDLARVALAMARQLPGAPAGRWRLFEGSVQGPLLLVLEQGEEGGGFDLLHRDGRFQLLDEQGQVLAGWGELFEVIAAAYGDRQRDAMGIGEPFAHNLRVLVGRLAARQRDAVARLLGQGEPIGWFRPPRRLDDGRVGYPLSGRGASRGRPQALFARVRAVYPTFDDAQIDAWLQEVRRSGRQVESELARLGHEFEALDDHLRAWSEQPASGMQRRERRHFAQVLLSCWQRRGPQLFDQRGQATGYRLSIWALSLERLPELPEAVSFPHIHELSLMGLGLREMPQRFLGAFPNLQVLELASNRLTRLPPGLEALTSLRELDLYDNRVVLDTEQAMTLANGEMLEFINLSRNPLGRTFPLYRLDRLRRLYLRATGINELPPALMDRLELTIADLRDNQITTLPERFYRAPIWVGRTVMLTGNPLDEQAAQRLEAFSQAHGMPAPQVAGPSSMSLRRRWLDAADSVQRAVQSSTWDELEAEDGADDFFAMLARLLETVDFRDHRQVLANRVFTLLQSMCRYEGLRSELFSQARMPLTCQDSVILSFSALELRMLVWQARVDAAAGGQEQALVRLGRQLWRLDEVERIALEDIQARRAAGSDPDEIEVSLAYRLALRDALDLPGQPADMAYADVAGLDRSRIDQARERVLALQTPERLAQSLVERDFWQEHLLRAHAEVFEALDAPFHRRVEALMERSSALPEGQYLARMNSIGSERQAARRERMLALTRIALAEAPPASDDTPGAS
ncbi:leucine-rich repeat domain-containing protein [Pseudomonas sp. S 311-6]|uniref:NEL-type E3 ubiquitin ligase domain-containing protein n=1 Tax=Pseudomonas TaxID=286 RepID=UPI00209700DC|nr:MULTISPECIES: NEL-type E3 ubiquitin ligase domain-containing protein [Pseudomonas]MCO7565486.1 leucine-rich repeat domain-containing protein [Pseudomonas mosselii]MCO7616630.1 leucine-rich repeat domain-containing protein [Pseudomonas guariconensis]MCO7640053.1 leucine-rich repeat domain-containing protein [Pseudomonas sp. S 311-6]